MPMASTPRLTEITYTPQALADLAYWKRENPERLVKIAALIEDAMKDPTSGIGKPKQLKYSLEGQWSRRITEEHRLVYSFTQDTLQIIQARHHY